MFFFAMEEMLVLCRPFNQICWLPGTCSGSARPVGLEVGSVCAPQLQPLLQTFGVIIVFDN